MDKLMRLVLMIRGIAYPLALAYCRFFLIHCAQKLPNYDTGTLLIESYLCTSSYIHTYLYNEKEWNTAYIACM